VSGLPLGSAIQKGDYGRLLPLKVNYMVSVILKTRRGMENIVASHVLELFNDIKVEPRPFGSSGIVFVSDGDPDELANKILAEIPEVEKALPVHAIAKADLNEIAKVALKAARGRLFSGEFFAVRTTRRGKHDFTSIDVNVAVGAKIKEILGNPVNLDNPEKVIWVEIFHDKAYISITKEQSYKKPKPDKTLKIMRKISIIQLPFLGDLEGAYRMGVRIGRAAQAFEVGELIISLLDLVNAIELKKFLEGVLEGIESRLVIQKKTYHRPVKRTNVLVYELYQLSRMRRGEVFIITSAKGKPVSNDVCREIAELLEREKRINVFIGAREGIPSGLFRWSKLVVNLCPGITFATEHGIPTILTLLINCYYMVK